MSLSTFKTTLSIFNFQLSTLKTLSIFNFQLSINTMNNLFAKTIAVAACSALAACADETNTGTIETRDASSITDAGAVCGGSVYIIYKADDAFEIADKGILLINNGNELPFSSGKGVGTFTCALTDLSPSTTYQYRAYANLSSDDGTSTALGETKSFTTKAPTVEILDATATGSSIRVNCRLNAADPPCIEWGICYSSVYSTVADLKINESGDETYVARVPAEGVTVGLTTAVTLGGLTASRYYLRAYAINTKEITYGAVWQWEAGSPTPPTPLPKGRGGWDAL
jgi:hypothetical protein